MRNNDGQKSPRSGFIPSSFRAISSYLRIVSSGASTVARSAASVASSIVDRDEESTPDQVFWAGFDKLDVERDVHRRVLLLGYRSGFQVWDVEEADNVRDLVSEHEGGAVSFMQMLPHPSLEDKFSENRPLLVVCTDNSGGNDFQDGFATNPNGQIPNINSHGNGSFSSSVVKFYSLSSQSYVHSLKFRSVVYSVRCSSRVVAISQAAQIHCLDASTLERSYTIVTNPIVSGPPGCGSDVGYGPLAVGPRWVAYSGIPIADPQIGRVLPKQFTTSASFSASNGSLVAHYAKESSKHIAAGIVTLGDMGYKKLSRYCSELLPENNGTLHKGDNGLKGSGMTNGHHVLDEDIVGIVIVRDIVSKSVVAQFRAHKSPISALCFDPSGTLLVTASIQGHNINVFKIMPGNSKHLYQLQRGLTNAVIRDISFSDDGRWIMISSSRGTSHLFAINPHGGSAKFQYGNGFGGGGHHISNLCISGPPVTLSAISRIRNGHSGWRGTVTGAAAAATGRFNSLSGAIASVFHNSKGGGDLSSDRKAKFHLLVFSPSGQLVQYALRIPNGLESREAIGSTDSACDYTSECEGRLLVEAVQRWNVCQKWCKEHDFDVYGDNANLDTKKIYPEGMIKVSSVLDGVKDMVIRARGGFVDKHRCYLSEAELQMHQQLIPIWAKPRIYFQSMSAGAVELAEEDGSGGEIQTERIPTRTIETRVSNNRSNNGRSQDPQQKPGRVGESKPPFANDPGPKNVAAAELMHGVEDTALTFAGDLLPENIKGFVNNNKCSAHKELCFAFDDTVNNRGSSKTEDPVKTVNTNKEEGLKMENHFEDKEDYEFG